MLRQRGHLLQMAILSLVALQHHEYGHHITGMDLKLCVHISHQPLELIRDLDVWDPQCVRLQVRDLS